MVISEPNENQCLSDVEAAQNDTSLRLEAHRGEKLLAHCLQVGTYARKLVREMPLQLPEGLAKEAFEKLAFLAGACHDFGKATNRFQVYLHSDDWREKQRSKSDPLTRHALLGAVVAHAMLLASDLDKELTSTPFGRIIRFAPFWVIRRHHGNLLWAQKDLTPTKEDGELLSKQLDDCRPNEFNLILQQIAERGGLSLQTPITHSLLRARLKDILLDIGIDQQDLPHWIDQLRRNDIVSLAPWLLLQQLFSVLLDADKSYAAVEIRRPVADYGLNPGWVAQYRKHKFRQSNEGVNAWRSEVSQIAGESVQAAPIDTPFFQLTLPTGLGKTLVALDCALRLRERLRVTGPYKRTIVYALPFLSILEQAAGVYDELFALALGCDELQLPSELMIRHHHLAELRYVKGESEEATTSSNDDREFNPNQAQLMIEGWRSALVMTTTVQLFQSLFSGRNRTTRKLHRLTGAIVILDEVQSIPFKYWPLINKAMRAMSQLFDTRFVLVTATQPGFLETSDERKNAIELVPSYKDYFDKLNRTVTGFELNPRSIESFAETVKSKLFEEHAGEDALIVVNTINAAIKLFNVLKSQLCGTHDVMHLSTNIVPHERARRIGLIKQRQSDARPLVVISTQLVEAGVDLSFPVLFRDFAPFSAVVQAAGRANRSAEYQSRGRVYVYKLMDARHKILATLIYDSLELNATERVVKEMSEQGFMELSEKQLIAGVERYFAEIKPKSTYESYQVLEGAKALSFKQKSFSEREALEAFRLIEDKDTQEVFIELDDHAAGAWCHYNALLNRPFRPDQTLEESFLHAGQLRAARTKCLPFTLSVPRRYFVESEQIPERHDEVCYVAQQDIASVYDSDTGWLRLAS